jgi:hypothetical protein
MFKSKSVAGCALKTNDRFRSGGRMYLITDIYKNADETVIYAAPVRKPSSRLKLRVNLGPKEMFKIYNPA